MVLHFCFDLVTGNIPKIIGANSGKTIIIGGPAVSAEDEEELLHEEQELELSDVHVSIHNFELSDVHVSIH